MTKSDRIKAARHAAQLSQTELALQLGVTKGAVSQLENGATKNLRDANLVALERATGHRAEWISTGKGPKMVLETAPGVRETPTPYEFRALLESMDDKSLQAYSTESIIDCIITLAAELKRRG